MAITIRANDPGITRGTQRSVVLLARKRSEETSCSCRCWAAIRVHTDGNGGTLGDTSECAGESARDYAQEAAVASSQFVAAEPVCLLLPPMVGLMPQRHCNLQDS